MLILWIFIGSLLGIAGMVYLNYRLGLHTPAILLSLDDALARLDADQVGFRAGDTALLADDRKSALVEEAGTGRFGLLAARGDTMVIRYLEPGSVRSARMDDGRDIELRLNDFTFTPLRIEIADTQQARQWADRLNALQA